LVVVGHEFQFERLREWISSFVNTHSAWWSTV